MSFVIHTVAILSLVQIVEKPGAYHDGYKNEYDERILFKGKTKSNP